MLLTIAQHLYMHVFCKGYSDEDGRQLIMRTINKLLSRGKTHPEYVITYDLLIKHEDISLLPYPNLFYDVYVRKSFSNLNMYENLRSKE